MDNINRFETESIDSLIWKFSLPAIVGMVANASYNVVDRIFVGQGVGSLAISAITITYPISMLLLSFAMLIGIGAQAVTSLKLGEKQHKLAERILGNSISLSVLTSLILSTLIYLFLDRILHFFGAENEIYYLVKSYLTIILVGIVFQISSFVLNGIIRAEGSPRIAMLTMLLGAASNIVLDPIFIFGLRMGIEGAAIATVLAQFISAAWVFGYFFGKKSLLKFKLSNLIINQKIIKSIFAIGSSPFLMHVATSGIFILLNSSFLKYGGATAVAALGIINSVVLFIMMPIFGLNQGIQPIIGYNYGAKRFDRVEKLLFRGIFYATFICTLGFLLLLSFPTYVLKMFSSDDANLLIIGRSGLRIFILSMPLIGFQIILGAYFQAVGKPLKAIILTLTRQIIFIIPLVIILPKIFGLQGLWAYAPISDLLAGVLATTFFISELKVLRQKQLKYV